jgi:hypothetical protein
MEGDGVSASNGRSSTVHPIEGNSSYAWRATSIVRVGGENIAGTDVILAGRHGHHFRITGLFQT